MTDARLLALSLQGRGLRLQGPDLPLHITTRVRSVTRSSAIRRSALPSRLGLGLACDNSGPASHVPAAQARGQHEYHRGGGSHSRAASGSGSCSRALLTNAPVLVVDEPTAHLDPVTASELVRDVMSAAGERTVLLITHRTEGVELADRVIEPS
jgi:hypothetical protein